MVNVIDYMPGDTLLHRLNPVIKLGLAAAVVIGIFLSDTYVALLGFLALTLALGAYAGVVDRLFSLLKLLIPLALIMLALQLAFMRDGNVVWGFVTDEGLITGSKACLRLLGVALPLILMLMVTKLNDLANACVEVLHVPYRYAFTFTTALRFVPGVRTGGAYMTLYGEIPVQIDTQSVKLTRAEGGGELELRYDVYAGGDLTAHTHLTVTWRV